MSTRFSLGILAVIATASACTTEATAPKLDDTWVNTTQTSKGTGNEATSRSITFANGRFDQRFESTQTNGAVTATIRDCLEGAYTFDDNVLTLKVERHFGFDTADNTTRWRTESRTITGTVDFPDGDTLVFTPSEPTVQKQTFKRGAPPADLVCN